MNRQYRLVERSVKEKAPFPSPAFILAIIVLASVGYAFFRFANYMITESQMFQLKKVKVEGNRYIDKEEIIRLASVEPGVRLFQISTESLIGRVLRNPYLQGVSVGRSLPSTLIIAVQERKPVAYLIDNKIYMIDASGKILLKKQGMTVNNLPLITGLSVQKLLKNRQPLFDALALIKMIEEVDDGLFQFISEVHINTDRPLHLYLIRGGARVEIGIHKLYHRIFLLSEFVKNSRIGNKLDKIKKIDLTFKDRIVVTRKS